MNWTALPWQQLAWAKVLAAAKSDRLPHAWLIAGPAGTGKRHFAQGMAELLLKEAAASDTAHHLLAAGHHPDLIRLAPEQDKKQIAVEALREAMQRLALSSHRGGRRILLIEPADALNDNGVNALLKTLEEPPAAAHLILITERLMSLKPTLRSRCQILRPGLPTAAQGLAWLKQHAPDVPAEVAAHFARSPLSAAAEVENESWDPQGWAELLGGMAAAFKRIEAMNQKDRKNQVLPSLRWLMREALQSQREQLCGTGVARPLFGRLGASALSDWMLEVAQTHRALAGQISANPRMLLESLMIGLYERTTSKT